MSEIIMRRQASALGLVRYFTGRPCPHGHIAERNVIAKQCCVCLANKAARRVRTARKNRKHSERKAKARAAVTALCDLGIDLGYRPTPQRAPVMAFSRREAIRMGVIRYYTGKPCKHGHVSSRNIHNGCDECNAIFKLKYSSSKKGRKETRIAQKRRARSRQRAALKALKELGIQI